MSCGRVVGWIQQQPLKEFRRLDEVDLASVDRLNKAINFPEESQIDTGGFDQFDMNELVDLVVLPKRTGERGRADDKARVQSQHAGDVQQMALNPLAVCTALMQRSPEFDDEAGALSEFLGLERHETKYFGSNGFA